MFLVDSHCHFNLLDLNATHKTIADVINRAKEQNVYYFLNVCVSLAGFGALIDLAQAYQEVSASVGSHPNEEAETVDVATLVKLAQHPKVVAIGETGLDYFRSTGNLNWQRERFRTHIEAAKRTNKPLIIHTRDAKADTLQIMREEQAQTIGGVMHCFTEDWDCAKQALDLGFYISFSGIVTFKNAQVIQEVAKKTPLTRMLIETDSPYLAPNPHRGKPNEPSYVKHTAQFIADLRGITLAELAEATTDNFFSLFKGAVRPNV